jgi:hypothetical protein
VAAACATIAGWMRVVGQVTPVISSIRSVRSELIFLAYVGFSRPADQTPPSASGEPASGEGDGDSAGIWGEKRA